MLEGIARDDIESLGAHSHSLGKAQIQLSPVAVRAPLIARSLPLLHPLTAQTYLIDVPAARWEKHLVIPFMEVGV